MFTVVLLTAPRFPESTSSALAHQMQLLVTLFLFIIALVAQVSYELRAPPSTPVRPSSLTGLHRFCSWLQSWRPEGTAPACLLPLQVIWRPHVSDTLHKMEIISLLGSILMCYFGVLFVESSLSPNVKETLSVILIAYNAWVVRGQAAPLPIVALGWTSVFRLGM